VSRIPATRVGTYRDWARLRPDGMTGWVLTCDLCHLRETYYKFWPASRSLGQHVEMHEREGEEDEEI